MSKFVLDASALLAVVNGESGADIVADALSSDPVMSAVNLREVVTKLVDKGVEAGALRLALSDFQLDVVPFEEDDAYTVGGLREALPFGDRACLALAMALDLPVLTADRGWLRLGLPIEVVVIR